ncbi:DUF2399 domain-containing protein [Streptomyces sp. JJ66]|uniref:DUF2399 domain-containing protein n=1 Tax=Streptomyces sp. JJ66 TaxID=2803843 RepID=UPI0027E33EB3|nr:DUF2399 domain-containing protein [Streptomyces sp. JJ66]
MPWEPWRYTAADYRAAVATAAGWSRLDGASAAAPWDPALAHALAELDARVEEEAVLDHLLADLAPAAE